MPRASDETLPPPAVCPGQQNPRTVAIGSASGPRRARQRLSPVGMKKGHAKRKTGGAQDDGGLAKIGVLKAEVMIGPRDVAEWSEVVRVS